MVHCVFAHNRAGKIGGHRHRGVHCITQLAACAGDMAAYKSSSREQGAIQDTKALQASAHPLLCCLMVNKNAKFSKCKVIELRPSEWLSECQLITAAESLQDYLGVLGPQDRPAARVGRPALSVLANPPK